MKKMFYNLRYVLSGKWTISPYNGCSQSDGPWPISIYGLSLAQAIVKRDKKLIREKLEEEQALDRRRREEYADKYL